MLDNVKLVIKSLILSTQGQVTIKQLECDFHETEGYKIPCKEMGFDSVYDMLQSLDEIKIFGKDSNAVVKCETSENTRHIEKLVAEQRQPRLRRGARFRNGRPPASQPDSHKQLPKGQKGYNLRAQSEPVQSNWLPPKENAPIPSMVLQSSVLKPGGVPRDCGRAMNYANAVRGNPANYNNNRMHYMAATPSASFGKSYKSSHKYATNRLEYAPKDFREKSRNHACRFESKTLTSAEAKAKAHVKEKVCDRILRSSQNMQRNGNDENYSHSSKTVTPKETRKGFDGLSDKMKQTAKVPLSQGKDVQHKSYARNESTCNDSTVKRTKSNLFSVGGNVEAYSSAMDPAEDSDLEGKREPLKKVSFAERKAPPRPPPPYVPRLEEAIPAYALDEKVLYLDIVEPVVSIEDVYHEADLPDRLLPGTDIQIFISEVHSPFKFWFHECAQGKYIDKMMNDINKFYCDTKNILPYGLPKSHIAPGTICIAVYNKVYHRAKILGHPLKERVKVIFVDFGTVSFVLVSELKRITKTFARPSIQTLRGSLAYIKPAIRHWDLNASLQLVRWVSHRKIAARIIEIDAETNTVYMKIAETRKARTHSIQAKLVEAGYAAYDSEWLTKETVRVRHKRENYPSFKMLESGLYPTLGETERLLNDGIDFENIIDLKIYGTEPLNADPDYKQILDPLEFELRLTNPFKDDIVAELQEEKENKTTETD